MVKKMFLLAITLLAVCAAAVCQENSKCPLWHYHHPENSTCVCGREWHGIVLCSSNHDIYLRVGFAMGIMDSNSSAVVIGENQFAYVSSSSASWEHRGYYKMPKDALQLIHNLCKPNHREGFLCERCIPGYGPAPYDNTCTQCRHSPALAITLYLATKIVPIAFWFFLIMAFRIDITKGPMLGYLLYCILHTIIYRELFNHYTILPQFLKTIMYVSFCISSIWNLDFLQLTGIVDRTICISHKLHDSHMLLLNFVSVLIPLFLVAITYLFIELHARNTRIIVYCWKPFHPCFVRIRRNWSATDSIIHAYASLLLLSFPMLNYNTYSFFKSTKLLGMQHLVEDNALVICPLQHLYNKPLIYYFVVVALLFILLSVLPAVMLLLHPIRQFQKMLQSCCSIRFVLGLNTFVETFQGPFKDGNNGTHDFRILPGAVACLILFFAMISSVQHAINLSIYLIPCLATFFAIAAVLSAHARPCKSSTANTSVTFHCMWMAGLGYLLTLWDNAPSIDSTLLMVLLGVCVPFPHVLMAILAAYKMKKKLNLRQKIVATFKRYRIIVFAKQSYPKLLTDYPTTSQMC